MAGHLDATFMSPDQTTHGGDKMIWGRQAPEYPLLAALGLLPEKPRLLSCGPSIRTPEGLTQFLLTAHSHTTLLWTELCTYHRLC